MKNFRILTVLVIVFLPLMAASAEMSSNYPLYSLNNVVAYEVSEDAGSLFTFEKTESGLFFTRRDMTTGSPALNVRLEVPEAYFMNTVIDQGNIYLFQVKILDREKRLMETSIFKIDTEDGQVENIYQSEELLGFAERFYATESGLLLTEKRGNNPFLFSLKSNSMKAIKLDEDFRIRAFDRDRDSAVIIRQTNFSTSLKSNDEKSSYTEGDGSLLDVYVCDFSDNYKLEKVGQYQPSYVISKDEEETFLPHFIIENDDYSWAEPSFMTNRYPIYPGALVGDVELRQVWESLVGYESVSNITFVGDQYALANRYLDSGEMPLAVYDLKNPQLNKTETVSQHDRDQIKTMLTADTTVEKRVLDPEVISRVFDARFYEVSLVTTSVDSSDGGTYTYSSTERFLAVARDDVFSVLKKNEELVPFVAEGFVLNEKSAVQFQEALDALFPVGHFAEKHKAFYKTDDFWVFVRDESFGEKVGIKVIVNEGGIISAVGAEDSLSEN